jgi:hypothetical protein
MTASQTEPSAKANNQAILQDCRGIAARRLPSLIYEVLKQIKNDLVEIAPSTQKYELFALYREALDMTQGRWSQIESRFRTHLLDRFDQASKPVSSTTSQNTPQRLSRLDDFKLMDADDLEESLAANTIANAISSHCVDDLVTLNPRLGTLLNDPEFKRSQNPLSPEIIGESLMDTLQELDGSTRSKLILVPMFSRHFPKRVQAVYREINQHLFTKGVLPALPLHHQHKATATKTPEPAQGQSATAGGKSPPPGQVNGKEPPQDMFAMLQQLMSLGRIGSTPTPLERNDSATKSAESAATAPTHQFGDSSGGGSSGGNGGQFPELPTNPKLVGSALGHLGQTGEPPVIFLNQLTAIQHGEASGGPAMPGIAAVDTSDGRVNVLHALRQSESVRDLSQIDSMTLDIVALLFDFILDDRRIPDAMKAVIGRLQIPMLKVALVDKSLFANKAHPARQILDTMAQAAMGWNAEEGHESALYQKISTLVVRIMKEFTDDTQIFIDLLAELKTFLGQESVAAKTQTVKAAQQILAREQIEKPKQTAHDEVARRLELHALPKLVRDFLSNYWEPLLAMIYTRAGQDSETWIKAITTMDDLVWSVTPKVTSQDRKKLLVILPKLLKWLDQGLQFLNTPQAQREPFFAALVKYHTEAVRPGLDDAAFAKAFDIAIARPSELARGQQPGSDFEPVVAPDPQDAMETPPDPVLVEEIVDTPEPEVEEIVIGDVTWASGDFEQEIIQGKRDSSDFDLLVKNMKRGTWIELDLDNGETSRAKLAWISPLRGVYLFTNRLGQKAISINAAGLANKFREGKVRLIDNVPLMDRAVSGLIGRLQNNAAPAATADR